MNIIENPNTMFRTLHPLRVRYNEADMQGIVFNANYLVYADIGVSEYFRALALVDQGADQGQEANVAKFLNGFGGDCWVRHADVDFRAPARADDLLSIGARITRFGRTSFSTCVHIYRGEALLAVINLTQVWFDAASETIAPVAPGFIAAVEAYEAIAPERAAPVVLGAS